MPLDKKCWSDYGVSLRKRMFQDRHFDITVAIEAIQVESNTSETVRRLEKLSFWEPIRAVKPGWDILFSQGILVEFDASSDGKVSEVTFRLEASRQQHLERIIESRSSQRSRVSS